MSNKLLPIICVIALLAAVPAFSADAVTAAFSQINQQGLQRLHKKPPKDANAEKKERLAEIKVLDADIEGLTPDQLVCLIKLCRQKLHHIPSDSAHEMYSDYFEQAIAFSIDRLGEQKTDAAREALNRVKSIISGAAHLEEVWDEAKTKQGAR